MPSGDLGVDDISVLVSKVHLQFRMCNIYEFSEQIASRLNIMTFLQTIEFFILDNSRIAANIFSFKYFLDSPTRFYRQSLAVVVKYF
jgi:hypothetical protein